MPQLFNVHCGFYDKSVSGGLFESHTNFLIVAESFKEAKAHAKAKPEFKKLKMHVDGIQEIAAVEGFQIQLKKDSSLSGKTVIKRQKYGGTKIETLEFEG